MRFEPSPILDFKQYSNTMANVIKNSDPRFSIGIYGEWGTGKTTLMRSIEDKIVNDVNIMTVWFNAWRFEREDQFAIVSLMKTIAFKMGEHSIYKEVKPLFLKGLVSVGKGLATKFILPEKSIDEFYKGIVSDAKVLEEVDKDTIYFDGMKKIENAMKKIREDHPSRRIVVFIDDLDRCSPTRTLEVFESIKVFLDLEGFIYVIGLSYETASKLVSVAYKESGISGDQYIRKIIQIPIVIQEWNASDTEKLVENISKKLGEKYSEIINQNKKLITVGVEANPREVKRFINNFIVAYEIYTYNTEIKPKELLALQAIRLRWNNFYKHFSSNEDFRKIIKEYIGKQEHDRAKIFTSEKDAYPKNYVEVIKDYVSNHELWDIWAFLSQEEETISGITNWEIYRRAVAVEGESLQKLKLSKSSPRKKEATPSQPTSSETEDYYSYFGSSGKGGFFAGGD